MRDVLIYANNSSSIDCPIYLMSLDQLVKYFKMKIF